MIGLDADGAAICGPCVGSPLDFACHHCGRTGDNHGASSCRRCVLDARLTALLGGADGAIAEQRHPLQRHLASSSTPASLIAWIEQSATARTLREFVLQDTPVTHAHVDALPSTISAHYLRDLLVRAEVLPARDDEYVHWIAPWLQTMLAGVPVHHVPVLTQFARWHLLPKARRPPGLFHERCFRPDTPGRRSGEMGTVSDSQ
ncbi:hypothetical protein [Amycolatopsis sp. NBC_00438]|uniref:hypothetical protein n=1 Tax=Amycolatopsis sp. NBC_00438 TaxID=2903558 RepID=UPI002E1B14EA